MPATSLIAIGASAGGVEALQKLVRRLPADLDAAVAVVLHITPGGPTVLASILSRAGPLDAVDAVDDEPVEPGRIYVARPDRHLLVEAGRIRVGCGPKENSVRPAVNALFRSVATLYQTRAVGIVLSGSLTDGTAGLAEIKRHGGFAMVEDPETAQHPSMPLSAIRNVDIDVIGDCDRLAEAAAARVKEWHELDCAEGRQRS